MRQRVSYVCHCCKCCCMALAGISRFGYPKAVVTSGFIASVDYALCKGCGTCARACSVDCIRMEPADGPAGGGAASARGRRMRPVVDESICLGCGVCGIKCPEHAMRLSRRPKRVIPPENTFERTILMCLERGTLEDQIFDNPRSLGQGFMRALLGGFLRLPPVKRALMGKALRSRFLSLMAGAARRTGQEHLLDI